MKGQTGTIRRTIAIPFFCSALFPRHLKPKKKKKKKKKLPAPIPGVINQISRWEKNLTARVRAGVFDLKVIRYYCLTVQSVLALVKYYIGSLYRPV